MGGLLNTVTAGLIRTRRANNQFELQNRKCEEGNSQVRNWTGAQAQQAYVEPSGHYG